MASGRNGGVGPIGTILLMLVVVFIPIIGHIILTVIILGDDLSCGEKVLWLLVVWLLPVIGPLLYLLIGQRRDRLVSRLSS
ncbi:MAG TPA: PLDc N-terminal domain-containing protein [Ktedonobacterales bacterium]